MQEYKVIQARPAHFQQIIQLCRKVYASSPPWREDQLASHQKVFPQGQLVAVHSSTGEVTGFAASLIVSWDDYGKNTPWRDFTAHGMFTNHNPGKGRTLYGAEILVDPSIQRKGIGSLIYRERANLVRRLNLLRIRAGARLRGYHRHAKKMSPSEYLHRVVDGRLKDPTLSFQIKHGFKVVGITANYLRHDPESLGYAAVIEWLNPAVATERHFERQRRSEFHR